MEKLHGICALLLILFVFNMFECNYGIPVKKRLYNCFKDINDGTCEESRIKIDGHFYECDDVTLLRAPPNEIYFNKGEIRLIVVSEAYTIINETVVEVDRSQRDPQHISDSKGNIYFVEDDVPVAFDKDTGKETQIISHENAVHPPQLAIDHELDKLFILSFSSVTSNSPIGQLFLLNNDLTNAVDGKIKADLVVNASITALAVDGGRQSLLLGIEQDVGSKYGSGKIITLKRRESDPCSQGSSSWSEIFELIKELQDKILRLIDEAPDSTFVEK